MTNSKLLRAAALSGVLLAAAVCLAAAEEPTAIAGVQLSLPDDSLSGEGSALAFTVGRDGQVPFIPFDGAVEPEGQRRLELELAAGGREAPLDVSIVQRASVTAGDVSQEGRGAALRIGQGLVNRREDSGGASTYVFVASENQALTYQPGARSDFGGQGSPLTLQDRVEIGDLSAGVTFERNGVQTSLAYVERSESTRVGRRNVRQNDSFAGVTVTARN